MCLARFLLLLSVFVSLSSQFSTAFARRVEECGIERVIYSRGSVCAVEAYFEGASLACPGSQPVKTEVVCEENGFDLFTRKRCDAKQCPRGWYASLQSEFRLECTLPASLNSCQLPVFGVRLYTACIAENVYNDCSIRKTRTELDAFLANLETARPAMADLYVSNKALIAIVMSHDVLDHASPEIPRSFRSFSGSHALS